ncbi:histidine phosphatase family protein [Terricaulis silvestris]|uniref:Bifunctional RNase H/acid phosphatase n=1 Tax=Terricaulis silvestris TaxID=2686094 RepID=A0A6I6MQR2_9CAUL|nr:histidine phosphatase family protein [Terricaulis silvestris]QGZ95107.1 bifunctional RNase H/acid phosphatase [Terricaulis silvestris]
MPRLFLVRHAEPATSWGGEALDPGLSDLGREQAEAAAKSLSAIGNLAVVSSPMLRCRETAAPYAALRGVAPRIEPRVSEVVAPASVQDRRNWLRETFPWDDGVVRRQWNDVAEDLRAWREACGAALREMTTDTVVFTHFIAINAIVSAASKSAETIVFRPAHCSITELELASTGLRVVRLGGEMRSADVR